VNVACGSTGLCHSIGLALISNPMAINQTNLAYVANLAWDTLLDLGGPGTGPMHARLSRALREAIRSGRLPDGAALPPSRDMAAELSCSRWVVTEAYEQLVAEGYLEARVGSGTRVRRVEEPSNDQAAAAFWSAARGAARSARDARGARPAEPAIDLAPGLPDLRHFPFPAWLAAVRSVAVSLPYTEMAYPNPNGHRRVREVLASYLARVRGAVVDPSDVTVTSSVTDGVTRACRALRAAGVKAVAVEDPGWGRLREAARVAGLECVPVPVDDSGLRVDVLADYPQVRAAVVSPAHQVPTGSVLAPERRAALLEWARGVDALILEDDYDAEFRYDRRPVGTLQGTDPTRVALLGSLSKTLSPALGIGWIVTPAAWTRALRATEVRPAAPPLLDQLAFSEFVASGSYDRHMRAARKRYRARRDALVAALAAHLPDAHVSGAAAGLHVLVRFDSELAAPAVVERAAQLGVHVSSVEAYRVANKAIGTGLVLGYGNLGDGEVDRAVAGLAAAVTAIRSARNRSPG
jgi:GntR family transcriptional regulator/MocR family aminotransferase